MSLFAPLFVLAATVVPFTDPVPAPVPVGDFRIVSNGVDAALDVWSSRAVYATRIDVTGKPLDSSGIVLDDSPGQVAAASVADGWVAVWATGTHERTRFIGRDGSLGPIADLGVACVRPEIAQNATRLLAVCSGDAITATLLDTRAQPAGANIVLGRSSGSPATIAVSSDPAGFVVFASSVGGLEPPGGLWAQRVDLFGGTSPWKLIESQTSVGAISSLSAGFDGGNDIAVWRENGDVHEAVLATNLVGFTRVLIAGADSASLSLDGRWLSVSKSGFLGVYDLMVPGGQPLPIATVNSASSAARIDGGVIVAWKDEQSHGLTALAQPVLIQSPVLISLALPIQQNARIATDGFNRAAVWEEPGAVKASLYGFGGAGFVVSSDRQPHAPAIAAQPGLFFIVWIEIEADGSGTLLGRRYTRQL